MTEEQNPKRPPKRPAVEDRTAEIKQLIDDAVLPLSTSDFVRLFVTSLELHHWVLEEFKRLRAENESLRQPKQPTAFRQYCCRVCGKEEIFADGLCFICDARDV